jgi:hypothetical protein
MKIIRSFSLLFLILVATPALEARGRIFGLAKLLVVGVVGKALSELHFVKNPEKYEQCKKAYLDYTKVRVTEGKDPLPSHREQLKKTLANRDTDAADGMLQEIYSSPYYKSLPALVTLEIIGLQAFNELIKFKRTNSWGQLIFGNQIKQPASNKEKNHDEQTSS